MWRRVLSATVLSLVVLATSGCASLWRGTARSYNVAPSGLPWGEDFVRRALVLGSFDQAMARTAPKADGAPSDALLQALFRGQVAYYAGQWEESGRAFAEADRLTEQRLTRSATRGVLSILTNDHALAYAPPRTERLFSRYYAMMGRLQAGDVSGAAVDARRLSALLEESAVDLDPAERATHAMLRDVAGAVFEVAGEWNDAGVAYRNAALLRGVPRAAVDSISVSRPVGDSATVVMVVESGFVAHYVARTLAIPLDEGTARRLADLGTPSRGLERIVSAEARRRLGEQGRARDGSAPGTTDGVPAGLRGTREGAPPIEDIGILVPRPVQGPTSVGPVVAPPSAAVVLDSLGGRPTPSWAGASGGRLASAARWLTALDALPDGGVFDEASAEAWAASLAPSSVSADWTPRQRRSTWYLGDRGAHRHWMEINWPTLVRSRLPSAAVQLALRGLRTDSAATPWEQIAPLSATASARADISDAVGADARRLRGARLARLTARTVSRLAVMEALEEQHGPAAGLLAGLLVSAIERADTRAWHLLPGSVSVMRVTVPAGALTPSLLQGAAPNLLPHALPAHRLQPGAVAVLTSRLWRDPAGAMIPMTAANGAESLGHR